MILVSALVITDFGAVTVGASFTGITSTVTLEVTIDAAESDCSCMLTVTVSTPVQSAFAWYRSPASPLVASAKLVLSVMRAAKCRLLFAMKDSLPCSHLRSTCTTASSAISTSRRLNGTGPGVSSLMCTTPCLLRSSGASFTGYTRNDTNADALPGPPRPSLPLSFTPSCSRSNTALPSTSVSTVNW